MWNSEPRCSLEANLPTFEEKLVADHDLQYNGIDIVSFSAVISDLYENVKSWKSNMFDVPPGAQSKKFIALMNFWLDQFNKDTPLGGIALKVFMILPNLFLQKPSKSSKTKQHIELLRDRLKLWESGNICGIVRECKMIQNKLLKSKRDDVDFEKLFVRFMLLGKVNSALRLLEKNSRNGVLPMNDENLALLREKHPKGAPVVSGSLLEGPILEIPSSFYDDLDESMIEKSIARTHGAAGPSNMDGHFFRQIISRRYREEAATMKQNIAAFARKLASDIVDPSTLEAFTACRLIPLNKNPGLRPIGVGEALRRIVGKAVSWVVKPNVLEAAGPLQVAAGAKSGSEAACHSIRQLFDEEETEGVMLVDASNAFNNMNRQVALHNVQIICPFVASFLINIYRRSARMIIKDAEKDQEITSLEGTTQGCNLGMLFYALGLTPVVRSLNLQMGHQPVKLKTRQCWLADDACGVGTLDGLKIWFDILTELGKKFGYFVNDSKTWIILKNEDLLEKAKVIFKDTEVKFTTKGKRYLGSFVGTGISQEEYCRDKVKEWCDQLENLCQVAKSNPQVAYCAYTHGFQHKFTYFFRTIEGFERYLQPLDDLLTYGFLPTLFGSALTPVERKLVALPLRNGGLGISLLYEKAARDFKASIFVTSELVEEIKNQGSNKPPDNSSKISLVKSSNNTQYEQEMESVKKELSPQTKRCVEIACEKGASNWLAVLPLKKQGFLLNRSQFMDALNLRYYRELRGLPSICPCSQPFTITHALNCKKGGFIHMRHDNTRDFLTSLLQVVQTDVQREPPLQKLQTEGENSDIGNTADAARLDIRAKGFWRAGQDAYFDIRVTNPLAATAMKIPLSKVYDRNEKEKKRMYNHRVMTIEQGSFTPLVFSVFGTAAPECQTFLKQLMSKIATKRNEKYSDVANWVRRKLSFLCIKACLMCLRGTRTKIKKEYISADFAMDTNEAN